MHYLLTLMAQLAGAACVGYIYLADRWLTVGWGLYPTLAGALALSLIILPHGLAYYVRWHDYDDSIDDLVLDHFKRHEPTTQAEHDKLVCANDWLRLHPRKE